jgi:CubicO group peptidase (beta-lactamase class C family)
MKSTTERVDRLFTEWAKASSPGCALAVIQDGGIAYKQGYGMANLEYNIPITPKTIFHVASVSKQFVAMAIALLAREGKLSFDDDIRQYIPELPDFGDTISIRHLLHHVSGLRDQWELLILAGWRMDDVITTEDVLEVAQRQQELNFKPGEEHLYCNTGYTLLGSIVERVSGKSLRNFCEETIFQPLGMHSSHFHDDHEMIVENRAYSYHPKDENGFRHSILSYATAGATSLFTTVEDLALWERNFYDGTIGGIDVINQMHTLGVLNNGEQIEYALGLGITDYRGLKVVQHSGGDAGYRSHLMRFPEQHFSVAILGNLSTINPSELAKRVADIYLAEVFADESAAENEAAPIDLAPEQLADRVGVYYNASTARTYRLEMRDGKLVIALGPGFELAALSENYFQVAAFPQMKLKFELAVDGTLQMHEITASAKPIIYDAVTTVTPTMEEQAAYVGMYYSPELDVNYTVIVQEEQLVLQRRKYGIHRLLPTFVDGFTSDSAPEVTIVFNRDDKNSIAGFRLSTGRVRNLRFVRQNSCNRFTGE